jgi:hypothetical protein
MCGGKMHLACGWKKIPLSVHVLHREHSTRFAFLYYSRECIFHLLGTKRVKGGECKLKPALCCGIN